MFCRNCGKEQEEGSVYCYSCGSKLKENNEQTVETSTPVNQSNPISTPNVRRSKFALLGFIFSLIPVAIFMFIGEHLTLDAYVILYSIIVLPCSILGIVFSSIGLKHTSAKKQEGKGFAIAGLIVSIVILSITTFSFSLISY